MLLLLLAAQIANPGFERGMDGWRSEGHPGFGVEIGSNRGYVVRQAARGENYLVIGWRARSAAPRDAGMRVFTSVDARRFRGRRVRISAQTKAPSFADRNGRLVVTADGAEAWTAIPASDVWQRQQVELIVPRNARRIEIAFVVAGTPAELDADDVRLEPLRRR